MTECEKKIDRALRDYRNGVDSALKMSDSDCLRFANGMISAIDNCAVLPIRDVTEAKLCIPGLMDMLAAQNMAATVGHKGTPVIKSLQTA